MHGAKVGMKVGAKVGVAEGSPVGASVGSVEGLGVGGVDGVGASVCEGHMVMAIDLLRRGRGARHQKDAGHQHRSAGHPNPCGR